MPKMGHFRTMDTMNRGNIGKSTVKVRHTYFSSVFRYFLSLGRVIFKFSVISRYHYDLSPSIN